jgi:hypothetical protein
MPRFEVRISGKDLDHAQAALDTAGLGKMGALISYAVGKARDPAHPEGEREASTEARAVIVEAETGDAAKRLVEDALPPRGYSVRVKPAPPSYAYWGTGCSSSKVTRRPVRTSGSIIVGQLHPHSCWCLL